MGESERERVKTCSVSFWQAGWQVVGWPVGSLFDWLDGCLFDWQGPGLLARPLAWQGPEQDSWLAGGLPILDAWTVARPVAYLLSCHTALPLC